jgi:hypothetical protein
LLPLPLKSDLKQIQDIQFRDRAIVTNPSKA